MVRSFAKVAVSRAFLVLTLLVLDPAGAAAGGPAMTGGERTGAAAFAADTTTAVVRYQVYDLDGSVAFYTQLLGFRVVHRPGPVLAILARGHLHLILSAPGSSGSRAMADGREQAPGGWNRIVLYVSDLDVTLAALSGAGARFRNQVEVGPGGRQIQVDDPDGNPVELHESPAG